MGIAAKTSRLLVVLWLAFAAALLVFGVLVVLVTLRRISGGRWVLALAGCFPLITVLLQLRLVGFIPPELTLGAVTVVTFAAALAWPAESPDIG